MLQIRWKRSKRSGVQSKRVYGDAPKLLARARVKRQPIRLRRL
jgi:hypothetical protein